MNSYRTIICEEYLKERIYHSLAAGNDTFSLSGTDLKSLRSLMDPGSGERKYASLLALTAELKAQKEQFPIYGNMLSYPRFVQEIMQFARNCALYGITGQDLPADTESEAELRELVSAALEMPLGEAEIRSQRESLLNEAVQRNPEFSFVFETDPFRYRFLCDLKERTGNRTAYGKTAEPKKESLRFALNTRQEIEAIAQEICENPRQCTVILCDYAGQLPVLEQVFRRYGIPFSPVSEPVHVRAPGIYLSLVRLALDHSADALIQAMRTGAFSIPADAPLIAFAQRALKDISFDGTAHSLLSAERFPGESEKMMAQEKLLEEWLEQTGPELDFLMKCETVSGALNNAYALLQKHPVMYSNTELNAGIGIRTILSQTIEEVSSREDAGTVLAMIDGLSISRSDLITDFCTVTDLKHPVDAAEVTYIAGCSAGSFPGVPKMTGIFDEDYVRRTKGFPSLEERHALYMSQLSWIYHSGKELIFSCATNDYQGRNIEPAFEVTSRISEVKGDISNWNIQSLRPFPEPVHHLIPETAEDLFAPDGKIHGSISRFERWFQCPYSYFIESGMKAREFDTPGLDSASIGTVQHAFMEEMLKKHGKDYTSVDLQEIRDFLKPWFEEMKTMRPHDAFLMDLTLERMADGMQRSLQFLSHAEKDTMFRPLASEQEFSYEIIEGVSLKGIIDRIDISGDIFRILDYKSSEHKLSESAVKAGKQLQLLSYIFAAEHILARTPGGAYYFSLQSKASKINAGSFAKSKGIHMQDDVRDEELLESMSDSERKFSGWTFDPHDTDTPEFKKSFTGPLYDLERVRQCVRELYQYFREHLLSGDIAVDPLDDACKFCGNAAVCRNRKGTRKPKPVVMQDISLKKGKGDVE